TARRRTPAARRTWGSCGVVFVGEAAAVGLEDLRQLRAFKASIVGHLRDQRLAPLLAEQVGVVLNAAVVDVVVAACREELHEAVEDRQILAFVTHPQPLAAGIHLQEYVLVAATYEIEGAVSKPGHSHEFP